MGLAHGLGAEGLAHRQQRDACTSRRRRGAGQAVADARSLHFLQVSDAAHNAPSLKRAALGDRARQRATPPHGMDITQLLAFSVKNKASDLHLSAGLPPMIRVHGDVRRINVDPAGPQAWCTTWCTTS
jgi:hypothetical protein